MSTGMTEKKRERRKHVRYDYEAPVMILRKTHDDAYPLERTAISHGRICNYSMSGLYIESDRPFRPGTTLTIRVAGDEARGRSDYVVTVRWCRTLMRTDGHWHGLGVEYDLPAQTAVFGFGHYYPDVITGRSPRVQSPEP